MRRSSRLRCQDLLPACAVALSLLLSAAAAAQPATPAATPPAKPAATAPTMPPAGEPTPTELEYSESARKAYAQGMKEARDLVAQKKLDQAVERLDKLSAQRPREPQARFLKAVVLADQAKVDAAIEVYRGITADFPEMPEPHNNLAVLLASKGELEPARSELALALKSNPDYATAQENLGDVHAALAAVAYARAADLDKRNRTAPAKLKLVRDVTAIR